MQITQDILPKAESNARDRYPPLPATNENTKSPNFVTKN